VRNVSVARGNLALADQGVTVENEAIPLAAPVAGDTAFRLRLARPPLTFQCEPDHVDYDPATGRVTTPRMDLFCAARGARPAVALRPVFPTGTELWTPVPDLLDSPTSARHFVAEIDNQGSAVLRFGDGEYGREAVGATSFQATYRVGNGVAGNVGAESLAHAALLGPAGWLRALRNPLAATGGTAPETLDEVRRRAPQAFRAEQFRAVTEADYVAAARKLPELAGAVANFRWTGSWYTVFVGVDPRDPADLVRRPRGLTLLAPRLERRVRAFLTRYRLAGYDLEIRPPRFVPIELELDLCVATDHFGGDVAQAVVRALGNRVLADGSRGFFHSDHFTFGQPVYLSRIYAAVERVEGVESLVVRTFQRADAVDNGELGTGVLPVGPWEIAQLDNDPSFMENGVLRVNARGGKA
jgi:predicted phage baseplate assembly protein